MCFLTLWIYDYIIDFKQSQSYRHTSYISNNSLEHHWKFSEENDNIPDSKILLRLVSLVLKRSKNM